MDSNTTVTTPEHLEGPFGPVERRPRRRARLTLPLICRWLYVLVIRGVFLVGLFVVGSALWDAIKAFSFQTSLMLFTHRSMYQNQTLQSVTNMSAVVRPLIDKEQLFDVAVSVWIRATEEEEKERRKNLVGDVYSDEQSDEDTENSFPMSGEATDGPVVWEKLQWWNYEPLRFRFWMGIADDPSSVVYHSLYSDIVFKGLRLSDTSVSRRVNFTVPTAKFRDKYLRGDELKAVFILIPTSPSPMDYVTNFSSWISDEVWNNMTSRRTWPFPLGSENRGEKTFLDQAVERLSFPVTLTHVHDIPSRCPPANVSNEINWLYRPNQHPYITTRTHARIFKEFELMNFEAYNASHEQIKGHKCGTIKKLPDYGKSRRDAFSGKFCERAYYTLGNLETIFELQVPLKDGSIRTEWAYAPYMDSNPHATGPKDYVPVPVNRENCTFDESNLNATNGVKGASSFTESDSMHVSWHISFSMESPKKQLIHDTLAPSRNPVNHSASDYKNSKSQDAADLWSGVWGIRRDDESHPRRRAVLFSIYTISSFTADCLDVLYWYTRSSTAFISVFGTILSAIGLFIDSDIISRSKSAWSNSKRLLNFHRRRHYTIFMGYQSACPVMLSILGFVITSGLHITTAVLMLIVALKFEVGWWSANGDNWVERWVPAVRILRPTHKERASERLERSHMRLRTRVGILAALFLIYHFAPPHAHDIISPLHPTPDPSDIEIKTLYKDTILATNIVQPLFIAAQIFQLALNYHSGYFAGSYRLAVICRTVSLFASLLCFVPWLLGRFDVRGGLSAHDVLNSILLMVELWQALKLPRAPTDDADEDEE